jgi:hypothetical protein
MSAISSSSEGVLIQFSILSSRSKIDQQPRVSLILCHDFGQLWTAIPVAGHPSDHPPAEKNHPLKPNPC